MDTKRPKAGEIEERTAPSAIAVDGKKLRGTIPYGTESRDMGGWTEILEAGCLRSAKLDDCVATVDHAGVPIGRFPTTLELEDGAESMSWSVRLPESRSDVREAVERGDLQAGSWRMVVGADRWEGDTRHVTEIAELRDVSVVVNPAYPDAAVELRSTEPTAAAVPQEKIMETEVATEPENTDDREAPKPDGLRVEDRRQGSPKGLAEAFRTRGWPAERATLSWDEFMAETRALTVSADPDDVNKVSRPGVSLGFDQRYAFPVFPTVAVGSDVTSVVTMRQTTRELAVTGVVRDIDSTDPKAETSSTVDDVVTSMKQVASVQTGIPNVYLAQSAFRTVIESDLRLALNEALDGLILDEIATAGYQDPGSDELLVSIRKAMTTIMASGYNPDTLILTPANVEALDTLVSGITGADNDYVFAPAQLAPRRIFGLQVRISKMIPAPAVVDAGAFGRMYASPVSLEKFEADSGTTNRSNVRLELNAAFGTERQVAAIRIAGS